MTFLIDIFVANMAFLGFGLCLALLYKTFWTPLPANSIIKSAGYFLLGSQIIFISGVIPLPIGLIVFLSWNPKEERELKKKFLVAGIVMEVIVNITRPF